MNYDSANDSKFQFYLAPALTVQSRKTMGIKEAYEYITLNSDALVHTHALRNIIKEVHEGRADEKEVRRYKVTHFDFACFSGTFSYRRDDCLTEHSGLLCLDFDHVGDVHAVKAALLKDTYFTTQLLFTSPSGDGLKWVIAIDLGRCDHKTWFRAMQNYIRTTYQQEVDEKCVNVSRCCFLPHDGNCYVHPTILQTTDLCPF